MSGPPLHRRKLTRRKLLGGAAAGVAAASVPSFLPRSAGASTGHSLRMRSRYDIATLDPYRMVNRAEYDILSAACEKLVEIKPGKKWDWELGTACEEIEYLDDTHVRFRLVEGRPWTNGFGTVSAHDVKFSVERILAEDAVVSPEWVGFSHVEGDRRAERSAGHRRSDGDAVHLRRAVARRTDPLQEGDGEHRRRHLHRHSARDERPLRSHRVDAGAPHRARAEPGVERRAGRLRQDHGDPRSPTTSRRSSPTWPESSTTRPSR